MHMRGAAARCAWRRRKPRTPVCTTKTWSRTWRVKAPPDFSSYLANVFVPCLSPPGKPEFLFKSGVGGRFADPGEKSLARWRCPRA